MIGSFLNIMVMGWPLIAFRANPDMEDLGYFYTTCNAMYKTWVFLGWLPSAMFVADGFVASPIGTGKFDGGKGGDWGWNFWLMAMESGTWFLSIIIFAWTWGAFKANFVVKHVMMAHDLLDKYGGDIETTKVGNPDDEAEEENNKADGFDDDWQ